jgi:hypothetical protein
MRCLIILAAGAITIPFFISSVAAKAGAAVSERFLERPGGKITIEPSNSQVDVDETSLRAWVMSEKTKDYAHIYAWRVIPLDFAYLIALGGFLAVAAHTLALSEIAAGSLLGKVPAMLWLVFPAVYVVTDLLEDILIMTLLTKPASISGRTLELLAALRSAKIAGVAISLLQIFILGFGGAIPWI